MERRTQITNQITRLQLKGLVELDLDQEELPGQDLMLDQEQDGRLDLEHRNPDPQEVEEGTSWEELQHQDWCVVTYLLQTKMKLQKMKETKVEEVDEEAEVEADNLQQHKNPEQQHAYLEVSGS